MLRPILFTAVLASSMFACVAGEEPVDELAVGDDPEVGDGKGDDTSLSTYFAVDVHGDVTTVSRVNRDTTTCTVGVVRRACEVDALDLAALGFGSDGQATLRSLMVSGTPVLMRGSIVEKVSVDFEGAITHQVALEPTEIWVGRKGEELTGVVVMLQAQADPLTCTAPCEPIVERKLNSTRAASITGVDVGPLGVTEFEGEQIVAEAFITDHALIVSGERYTFTEDGHRLKGRTATAAYKRVVPSDFF